MTKEEARSKVREGKRRLTEEDVRRCSDAVCRRFLEQPFYAEAEVIFTYLAYNRELNTEKIIRQAWADGKRVAVPKTLPDRAMEFRWISSFYNIKPGYCNIPEPTEGGTASAPRVLMITPGVAFDSEFHRIGYGGGYYDRWFARNRDVCLTKVSLCYPFQLTEHLETEAFDVPVDLIVTPDRVLRRDSR